MRRRYQKVWEKRPADEVPADDESGGCPSASQGTAVKKAAARGEARCRSVGGGVWLRLVESCPAFTDVHHD